MTIAAVAEVVRLRGVPKKARILTNPATRILHGVALRGCRKRPHPRNGSVLVAALVCLSIVIAIVGSMLQGTLRARRQLHAQRDLRQTEILLRAGVDRAMFRLLNEAAYVGEIWKLPAEAIVGSRSGQITIEATRDSLEQPWRVRVVAEYGRGTHSSIRRSHIFLVPTNSPSDQE